MVNKKEVLEAILNIKISNVPILNETLEVKEDVLDAILNQDKKEGWRLSIYNNLQR